MKCLLTLFMVTLLLDGVAQDFVITRNGEELKSKVTEISDTHVSYKKYSNPDGPVYHIDKSTVFMIKYENGSKDVFDLATKPVAAMATEPVNSDPNSGTCTLIVYREGQFYTSALNYWIFVNGKKTCKLSNGKYLEIEFPEGLLEVAARRSGAEIAKKTEFIPIEAHAGETYYVEGTIVRSLTRRRFELSEVTESNGQRKLSNMTLDRCSEKME